MYKDAITIGFIHTLEIKIIYIKIKIIYIKKN
jgi:hypothetical protein